MTTMGTPAPNAKINVVESAPATGAVSTSADSVRVEKCGIAD